MTRSTTISVVTPTLGRPDEVDELLVDLSRQRHPPLELVLVDAAPEGDHRTREVVEAALEDLPFTVTYVRHGGGTAIQRNVGIDRAAGDFIAFVDDDIRLEPDYFESILELYARPEFSDVGGIAGYILNQHLDPAQSPRWRWYRRLRLFTCYEPGRYDYETGYPINRYLQPPYSGSREIDFMGSNCGVWRREVFTETGLRFHPFFAGYGVLEDAHLALRARRSWRLVESGDAHCHHFHSPRSRANTREIARKSATNYRFVFLDIVEDRNWRKELRFWRVQLFDLLRFGAVALRRPSRDTLGLVLGKLEGMASACTMKPPRETAARVAERARA